MEEHHSPQEAQSTQSTQSSSEDDEQDDSESDPTGSTDHGPWTRELHPKGIKKIIPLNFERHEYLCLVTEAGPTENMLSIHIFTENGQASRMDKFPFPSKDIIWSVHVEPNEGNHKTGDTEFFILSESEDTEIWEIWHFHDICSVTLRKTKSKCFRFKHRKVLEFPEYASEEAVFVRGGVAYAACFVPLEDPEPSMTECYPPDNPDQTLLFFNGRKWIEVGKVPCSADTLTLWIDIKGNPKFAFIRRHYIYKEAQAGEVCVGIPEHTHEDLCWTEVTRDAGRVDSLQFNTDGQSIIFAANFPEKNRAITTHLRLWVLLWEGLEDLEKTHHPSLLSGDVLIVPEMTSEIVQKNVVFFNTVLRDSFKSYVVSFSFNNARALVIEKHTALPFTAMCAPIMNDVGEILFYPSESLTRYVDIRNSNGDVFYKLKQMEQLLDFHVKVINYEAKDGTPLHGFLYNSSKVSIDDVQGLLVWVHGGPFTAVLPLRSGSCDYYEEVPFKALLINGFVVFAPVYRGSAGLSDEFGKGNIGRHGSLDGDLGDIIQGVELLQENPDNGVEGCEVGIFGQSYGGYMVLRALEMAPEIFSCGISIYGYFNTRWNAMETGDLTWEREYFGETKFSTIWAITDSDVDLRKITKPILFLNGSEDDVCPAAQARCAYHFLANRGVTTKLVVYKGEGHGFEDKNVQEDRDERILDWFNDHMLSDDEGSSINE